MPAWGLDMEGPCNWLDGGCVETSRGLPRQDVEGQGRNVALGFAATILDGDEGGCTCLAPILAKVSRFRRGMVVRYMFEVLWRWDVFVGVMTAHEDRGGRRE